MLALSWVPGTLAPTCTENLIAVSALGHRCLDRRGCRRVDGGLATRAGALDSKPLIRCGLTPCEPDKLHACVVLSILG